MDGKDKGPLSGLIDGLKSLSELEVRTVVGDVIFDIEKEGDRRTARLRETDEGGDAKLKGCFTRINLVAGDMQNMVDKEFLGDQNKVLEFHREQVKIGREIVTVNVKLLMDLMKQVGNKVEPLLGLDNQP